MLAIQNQEFWLLTHSLGFQAKKVLCKCEPCWKEKVCFPWKGDTMNILGHICALSQARRLSDFQNEHPRFFYVTGFIEKLLKPYFLGAHPCNSVTILSLYAHSHVVKFPIFTFKLLTLQWNNLTKVKDAFCRKI